MSELRFVRPDSGERVTDALVGSQILGSSKALGWDGVACEMGKTQSWLGKDLAFAGHHLSLNLSTEPLVIERHVARRVFDVSMPPGSLWVIGAGQSFTQRNHGLSHWCAFDFSLERVRRVLGRDLDLPTIDCLVDPATESVARALASEVLAGGPSGPLFADGLAIALISRLAHLSGIGRAAIAPTGALGAARLSQVLEKIEASIAESVTVEQLAEIAGLSSAHFAREFKRHTRETPHAYLIRRRLERAREMLLDAQPIGTVALNCGFSDQPHLSRLFVRRFGVTPGAFVRTQSRRRGRTSSE